MADDIAVPTQSAPQVSQTQPTSFGAAVAPVAQSAAQAPIVGTSPQWVATSQPMAAPAPAVQAQMGVQTPQYSPTPSSYQTPQATPQQDNPYKEAFNKVVGLLSSPVQFPFQGQQSTQTPAVGQGNYGSQQTTPFNNAVAPTSTPGINSNQGFSNGSSQTSLQSQQQAPGISEASLQIVDHFGPDAPAILNDYSCKLEDSLAKTTGQLQKGVGLLKQLNTEHKAYKQILTNPNILANYTTKFFGPQGPYPVAKAQAAQAARTAPGPTVGQRPATQAPGTQAPTAQQVAAARQQQQQQIAAQASAAGQRPAPQRPQMPAPPSPQAKGTPTDFWNSFGSASDRDPQNAWKYLNAAQQNPEIFRQKLLVME